MNMKTGTITLFIFVSPLYENVISHFKGWHHLTTVPSSQCCFFPVRPLTSQTSQEVSVCLPSCGPPVPVPLHMVSLCPSCSVCGHIIWGHCYLRLCCSRWPPADGASQSCCSTCVRPEALARGSRDRLRSRPAPGPTPAGRRGRTSPGTSRTWYCYGAVQEEGDIRLWADDEIPNTIYLLYTWCSFTCKHTTYSQSQVKYYVQASALSK